MIMRILALLALGLMATGARAEWREARSSNFIVYGDMGERQLLDFTAKLEKFDAVLRTLWKVPEGADSNPLTVLVVSSQSDVRKVSNDVYKDASGFYRTGSAGSYAVVSRQSYGGGEFGLDAERIFYHEYAHHFMMQYSPLPYPAWYVEGFAEFVATIDYDRKGLAMVGRAAMHQIPGLVALKPLALDRILTGTLAGLDRDDTSSFYGRSWLLTHYLMLSKERKGQLPDYLGRIMSGTPQAEALAAFGDLKALDRELKFYLRDGEYRYLLIPIPEAPADQIAMRVLRPAEAALAVERVHYLGGIGAGDADDYAKKVEAAAAQHPNDPFALLLLSAARFAVEDYAGADKAADALLALEPNHARGLLAKGMARMKLVDLMDDPQPADWKAARAWIVKANRADGNDPLPYVEYYMSFGEAREQAPEIAVEGLIRALQLAPQNQGLRINLALQLGNRGRFDDAAAVIRPIAFSPHEDGASEDARKFLAAFEQQKMPDFGQPPQTASAPGSQ